MKLIREATMGRHQEPDRYDGHKDSHEIKESLTGSSHSTIDKIGINEATMQELHESDED